MHINVPFSTNWAIAINFFQSILLAKNRLVTTGKCFRIQLLKAVTQRCPVKMVLLKISQYSQENTCVRVSFNKGAGLYKKRHQHRCFPVNITKFLRTTFFIDHPRWLLLDIFTDSQKETIFSINGSVMSTLNVLPQLILHLICQ